MAKQTKAQELIVEKNINQEQVTKEEKVVGVKETINNTVEDNTPEVKENTNINTPDKKNTKQENNTNKVIRIIQKRPSHYNLLMEDGTSKVIHKSLFDKANMVVLKTEQ